MPIETNFAFNHEISVAKLQPIKNIHFPPGIFKPLQIDLLGRLRGLVGNTPAGKAQRTWKGAGFNLIWRPNFVDQPGEKDFFLQLNFTTETLAFTDITGNGIANRGFFQKDIVLGGVSYLQTIDDSFDQTGQHFEPGVWANVPATTAPKEPSTVVRMGSIPHGTTINLQGRAFSVDGPPVFETSSITPFTIGSPDDGKTGLVHFAEETLATPSTARTDLGRVAKLTQAELTNPNVFLIEAIKGQTILKTTVLQVNSDTTPPGSAPDAGGGTDNIAFLAGTAGKPNAVAPRVTATFWIEHVRDQNGKEFEQLQYTQRVLLDFNGLHWPHVTVATMTIA